MTSRKVEMHWEYEDGEREVLFDVTASVSPGSTGGRDEPPSPVEVEIEEVRQEDGTAVPSVIWEAWPKEQKDRMEEAVLEALAMQEEWAQDDAAERRADR